MDWSYLEKDSFVYVMQGSKRLESYHIYLAVLRPECDGVGTRGRRRARVRERDREVLLHQPRTRRRHPHHTRRCEGMYAGIASDRRNLQDLRGGRRTRELHIVEGDRVRQVQRRRLRKLVDRRAVTSRASPIRTAQSNSLRSIRMRTRRSRTYPNTCMTACATDSTYSSG